MTDKIITHQELIQIIKYDIDTGLFTWKKFRGGSAKKNTLAGTIDKEGYRVIKINCKIYKAHRLAWFYTYGVFPTKDLDHINQIKNDNRIINLREVTNSQNHQNRGVNKNNSSGHKGVYWNNFHNKWQTNIGLNGKLQHIGYFLDINDAIKARKIAEQNLHPYKPLL
jgi:hypothetical protein